MDEGKIDGFVESSRPAIKRMIPIIEALSDAMDIVRESVEDEDWQISVALTVIQEVTRELLSIKVDSEHLYDFLLKEAETQINNMGDN